MKIAYVTTYDSSDMHAWSGLGRYIFQSLADTGLQMLRIGGLAEKDAFRFRLKKHMYARIFSRVYLKDREPAVMKAYAAQVEEALRTIEYDLVFSPGTIPIARLQTE
ncbi:MAG: group 1 glycosyl transferase, partial [Desulfosudaceae bacterium]